jgi:hypothetical protein
MRPPICQLATVHPLTHETFWSVRAWSTCLLSVQLPSVGLYVHHILHIVRAVQRTTCLCNVHVRVRAMPSLLAVWYGTVQYVLAVTHRLTGRPPDKKRRRRRCMPCQRNGAPTGMGQRMTCSCRCRWLGASVKYSLPTKHDFF